MPRGDRTGPAGMGPMTGGGAGLCAGYGVPGYREPVQGRCGMGFGCGRSRGYGMGMRWRHGWTNSGTQIASQPVSNKRLDELSTLKNQSRHYMDALQSINDRISAFEAEKK